MNNRVCEILGIEKPIVQGPLNWLTNGRYVAAVSQAGGLGVLGFNAGQTESVYTVEETVENMRREIRVVKSLTDKPFGINVAPTSDDPAKDRFTGPMLELMAEEGVRAAVMVGDFWPGWTAKFRERGIRAVFRDGNPSAESTRRAIDGGAEIVVATGFDEGGTLPVKAIGTFSIVPLVVDAAAGRVPVMAAGGIVDERTARAAFALGAEGLYVGTAFMMAEESPLADNIKQAAVKADALNLIMYRTIPAFYRSLPGPLPDELLRMSRAGATEEEIYKAQHAYIGMRDGMLLGDLSKGFASFGLGISQINAVEPVATVLDRLMRGVPR
ncbi:MAG: nitronate monooxygenase [Kiritimatiellae bacterium]|nr:nitronate monooxygenase [Kiritimatiellia bacterium]